ncbi:MAG: GTP 3',8-cyclase MoaA [Deltaproteobacteria bacterium]|nr:GTP 3',8-cyclase MoaA [Deltaproteobacteria bacterium]
MTLNTNKNTKTTPQLIDRFGRAITYLRVSITDRCNQNCTYCRSPKDTFKERGDILSYDEITRVISAFAGMGVNKVRITGGEPLVRKDLTTLIGQLSGIDGIKELTMTTNAVLLSKHAKELKKAGLKRVNISLDTLDPKKFSELTGGGDVAPVIKGIDSAIEAGLTPVRLNTVLMKGVNDKSLGEIIDFAKERGALLRFIECMPMRDGLDWETHYISIADVLEKPEIKERVDTQAIQKKVKAAAFFLPLKDGQGDVGFISPMSNRFCEDCNRLRLTSEGKIRLCLPSDKDFDLRSAIRDNATITEIQELLQQAVLLKPEAGEYNFNQGGRKKSMVHIGG